MKNYFNKMQINDMKTIIKTTRELESRDCIYHIATVDQIFTIFFIEEFNQKKHNFYLINYKDYMDFLATISNLR